MTRNETLHGLRGLCMLTVFCYHLHGAAQTAGIWQGFARGSAADDFLQMGRLSVDVFFMISGYLIPFCLLRYGSARAFLTNRVVRVYPTFLAPHVLLFTAGPLIGYKWMAGLSAGGYASHFISNLLFLPGVFDLPIAQLVAWTLSYEIAFYLLAAAAFALFRASPSPLAKAPLWAVWLFLTALALWHHPQAWFFIVGAVACWAEQRRPEMKDGKLDTAFCLAALWLMCASFDRLFPLSLAAGFVAFRLLAQERGRLAALLRSRTFQYFGEISYSFYLWHTIVLFPLKRIFAWNGGLLPNQTANVAAFAAASFLGSVFAAHLSWLLAERWLTRQCSRLAEIRWWAAVPSWKSSLATLKAQWAPNG